MNEVPVSASDKKLPTKPQPDTVVRDPAEEELTYRILNEFPGLKYIPGGGVNDQTPMIGLGEP